MLNMCCDWLSVDMCLDDESVDGGELQLNEMCCISPRTSDIASVRYVAQSRRQNLALELGGELLQAWLCTQIQVCFVVVLQLQQNLVSPFFNNPFYTLHVFCDQIATL